MAKLQAVPQQGFDEQTVPDAELEAALEDREAKKAIVAGARAAYQDADETAKGLVARLELPDGGVARVGRFRIERTMSKGRVVSFETKPKSRIQISLADD